MNELLPHESATLASRVFQLLCEDRLVAARDLIDEAIDARESLTDDMKSVLSLYNTVGLPKVAKLTAPRRRALRARMKEHPEYTWWTLFFSRVKYSDFLMGRKKGVNWKATFDWLMKPANLQKVIEGHYDPLKSGRLDANDRAAFRYSGDVG